VLDRVALYANVIACAFFAVVGAAMGANVGLGKIIQQHASAAQAAKLLAGWTLLGALAGAGLFAASWYFA